jgi:hypothetical protein
MRRSDHDKLLREVLAGDALEQRRAASLAAMLGVARRRRQRHALVTSGVAALVLALSVALLVHRRAPERRAALSETPSKTPAVTVISDEQLLALFADRSVALVGRAGDQQLLFLDRPATRLPPPNPISLNR